MLLFFFFFFFNFHRYFSNLIGHKLFLGPLFKKAHKTRKVNSKFRTINSNSKRVLQISNNCLQFYPVQSNALSFQDINAENQTENEDRFTRQKIEQDLGKVCKSRGCLAKNPHLLREIIVGMLIMINGVNLDGR